MEKETIIEELEKLIFIAQTFDRQYEKKKLEKILEYVKNN